MAKKRKPEEENKNENASSDIFKVLFGGGASEESGLGLGLGSSASNPKNGELENGEKQDRNERITEHLELRNRNRENEEKSDLVANEASEAEESLEKPKKKKKKNKSRNSEISDVDPIGEDEVMKKKEKEKGKEVEIGLGVVVSAEGSLEGVEKGNERLNENEKEEKKKKKKRKRSEIEEEYELRNQIVVGKKEEGGVSERVVGEKRKTVDDPAEMMVSKEGFDDENKLLRTIFVGNLPLKMKKKVLLKEFSKFGAIESARIRSVPLVDSKTPRKGAIFKGKVNESVDSVNAYIVFKEEKAAQASLSHNMAMVGSNHVRVDMACPPRKKLKGENVPLYDNKRTVFVGNLPFDVKDEELYQLFCGISQLKYSIEAVRVIRDPHTSIGKGIAYALFKTRDAANLAIKNKHLKLRDRELRLCHARADSTPSSKKRPMHASEDNSPSKKLATASTQSGTKKEARGTLSYQGLQANKSGVQKKDIFHKGTSEQGNQKYRTGDVPEGRQRKNKRPAVAARKANALKGIAGLGKQTGKKRKLESGTPESSHRNKKARKFR